MNTISSLLKFIGELITTSRTLKTPTYASGEDGNVKYIHFGRVCIFTGFLTTTTALTAGQELVSGLPDVGIGGNFPIYAINNNSATETVTLIMQTRGVITAKSAYASASRSLRISGAYLTSAVG